MRCLQIVHIKKNRKYALENDHANVQKLVHMRPFSIYALDTHEKSLLNQ